MTRMMGFDLDVTDPAYVRRVIDRRERRLVEEIGGPETVAALDTTPLADEPFDWSVVPEADRAIVADILERIDRICDELLDVEMRTICRVYLARIVTADPKLFNRSQRPDLIAAGLVWAALRMQGLDVLDEPRYAPSRLSFVKLTGVHPTTLIQRSNTLEVTLRRHRERTGTAGPWHSLRRRIWLDELNAMRRQLGYLDARIAAPERG